MWCGGGEPVALTGRELGVLELLLRRHPAVVDRRSLALQVWDDDADAVSMKLVAEHAASNFAQLSLVVEHGDSAAPSRSAASLSASANGSEMMFARRDPSQSQREAAPEDSAEVEMQEEDL